MNGPPGPRRHLRAVLDPNVLISAVLSRTGTPAQLVRAWLNGDYELIVSPALLTELARVLTYPKIAARVPPAQASELLTLLRGQAEQHPDPDTPPHVHSIDPDDDYLIALAETAAAVLVSGDTDLTDHIPVHTPVHTPAGFRTLLTDK